MRLRDYLSKLVCQYFVEDDGVWLALRLVSQDLRECGEETCVRRTLEQYAQHVSHVAHTRFGPEHAPPSELHAVRVCNLVHMTLNKISQKLVLFLGDCKHSGQC